MNNKTKIKRRRFLLLASLIFLFLTGFIASLDQADHVFISTATVYKIIDQLGLTEDVDTLGINLSQYNQYSQYSPPQNEVEIESESPHTYTDTYTDTEVDTETEVWTKLLVTSTAYTAGYESTGKNPGHPAYGITKTGTVATEGRTIAVDPKVIPLGSRVYIPVFESVFIAEDTGRLIKGNKIDIFIEDLDRALEWGVKKIEVYLIEEGE